MVVYHNCPSSQPPFCRLEVTAMDDDDYSDLTDLESDEYESKPNKKTTKSKDGTHTGYRIKNALKVPRATTYTAQALHGASFSVPLY